MPDLPYAALSHQGVTPTNNEDALFTDPAQGLWLVADGMGGHASGEVASRVVKDTVSQRVAAGEELGDAILRAHEAIIEAANQGVGDPGMGSTIVALRTSGHHFQVAWVGDSRAYLWNGALRRLSHDHSVVQTLLDHGVIDADAAHDHRDKHLITQALGSMELGPPTVDTLTGQLLRGQRILLCSDGLTDELGDAQIHDVLAAGLPPEQTVARLIQAALDHGGRDNVTAVLVCAGDDAPKRYARNRASPFEGPAAAPASPPRMRTSKRLLGIVAGAIAAVVLVLLIGEMR